MSSEDLHDYILIREATVLVQVPRESNRTHKESQVEFFDVRTGVQLRVIHPALEAVDLERGYQISHEHAAAIISGGAPFGAELDVDLAKVVSITDIRQRRLDAIVADSILNQLRTINSLLRKFIQLAERAPKEERYWLSQQVLSLVRKFSARELSELEEIVEWFSRRPKK